MQFMCLFHSPPLLFEVFGGWRCSRLLLCIPGPHMVLGLGPSEEGWELGKGWEGRQENEEDMSVRCRCVYFWPE